MQGSQISHWKEIEGDLGVEVVQKIGEGTFGEILKVLQGGVLLACKVQRVQERKGSFLTGQYEKLRLLAHSNLTIQPIRFLQTKRYRYMLMDFLSHNLQQKKFSRKRLTLGTVTLLALKLLNTLRLVHAKNLIHRDIKPQNIMVEGHSIILIDFGLAANAFPLPPVSSTIIGSPRYASCGSHFGISSKMDDLQSLMFVLMYLAEGSVPWQLKGSPHQMIDSHWSKVHDMKNLPFKQIIKVQNKSCFQQKWWDCIFQAGEIVRRVPRTLEPHYAEIEQQLQRSLFWSGTASKECFDWCDQKCKQSMSSRVWQTPKYN